VLAELTKKLAAAKRVVVLTGSGISAESGIPTFRGAQGLWKQYRPEELATPQAFQRQPEVVWEWYRYRRRLVRQAEPNAGHVALAQMAPYFEHFAIVTQNVDNLHQRAGSKEVIELHGNILLDRCVRCSQAHMSEPESDHTTRLPRCSCGGMLRPGVVWFGENLPQGAFARASQLAEQCDVFFSIGTSAVVYPAAALPEIAKRNAAYIVEINPDKTPITQIVDLYFPTSASDVLPVIIASLGKGKHA